MSKNDVKIIIFNPVINRMINELQRRFSDNNPILSGISSLNPQNKSFLDFQILLLLLYYYLLLSIMMLILNAWNLNLS